MIRKVHSVSNNDYFTMRRAQECDVGKYYLGKESWRIACEATRVIKSYHNVAR